MGKAKQKNKKTYLVKGDRYSINETFSLIVPHFNVDKLVSKRIRKINFHGDMIKPNSQRYQTFYYKGCTCVSCGLKASYFEKNKMSNESTYHLNLYGVDENGNEVLFTKDHILPVSRGGMNHIANFQTMCEKCNKNKSSKMSINDKIHTVLSKPKFIKTLMVKYYKKHPIYEIQK